MKSLTFTFSFHSPGLKPSHALENSICHLPFTDASRHIYINKLQYKRAAPEKEAAQTVGFFIRRVPRQFSLPAQMGFPSVTRRLYIVVLLYHHTIYMSTYKLKNVYSALFSDSTISIFFKPEIHNEVTIAVNSTVSKILAR